MSIREIDINLELAVAESEALAFFDEYKFVSNVQNSKITFPGTTMSIGPVKVQGLSGGGIWEFDSFLSDSSVTVSSCVNLIFGTGGSVTGYRHLSGSALYSGITTGNGVHYQISGGSARIAGNAVLDYSVPTNYGVYCGGDGNAFVTIDEGFSKVSGEPVSYDLFADDGGEIFYSGDISLTNITYDPTSTGVIRDKTGYLVGGGSGGDDSLLVGGPADGIAYVSPLVGKNLIDGGTGESGSPLLSIQEAIDLLPGPDVVTVRCLDGGSFVVSQTIVVSGKVVFIEIGSSSISCTANSGLLSVGSNGGVLVHANIIQNAAASPTDFIVCDNGIANIECDIFRPGNAPFGFRLINILPGRSSANVQAKQIEIISGSFLFGPDSSNATPQASGSAIFMGGDVVDLLSDPINAVRVSGDFAGSIYGATEMSGPLSAAQVSSPAYAGAISLYSNSSQLRYKDSAGLEHTAIDSRSAAATVASASLVACVNPGTFAPFTATAQSIADLGGGGASNPVVTRATTIFVSEAGTNGGAGTPEDPISNLQTAIDSLSAVSSAKTICCLDNSFFTSTTGFTVSYNLYPSFDMPMATIRRVDGGGGPIVGPVLQYLVASIGESRIDIHAIINETDEVAVSIVGPSGSFMYVDVNLMSTTSTLGSGLFDSDTDCSVCIQRAVSGSAAILTGSGTKTGVVNGALI